MFGGGLNVFKRLRVMSFKLNNLFKPLIYILLLLLGISFCDGQNNLAFSHTDHPDEPHDILFISSYNSQFPTFFDQIDGLQSVLPNDHFHIDLEFMDSKRFDSTENISSFYERLSYKLKQSNTYELIITSDDNAYQFALANRDTLFSGLPIVFFGVNNLEVAKQANEIENITGVAEHVSIDENISLATTLYPKATEIYAIVDHTLAAQGDYVNYLNLVSKYPNLTFKTLDLTTLSFEQLSDKLSLLTDDSIVLLLAAYSDVTQKTWSFEESVNFLVSSTSRPIFHPYKHGIGQGLLGGYVISHFVQGAEAGKIVKAILEETQLISDIPVILESPNRIILDELVFDQYKLDHKSLPNAVTFINQKVTFWSQYARIGLTTMAIISILLFLLIYLLYYIKKAKRIEYNLNRQAEELKDLYDDLTTSEEELRAQNDMLIETHDLLEKQKAELTRKQKLIENYAYYDFLTHLPNRHSLRMDLQQLLSQEGLSPIKGAIFFIDIDNFKHVNDQYGHSYGDMLLVEIASRLQEMLSNYGKLYRFGGDEFIAMISAACDVDTIEYIAVQLSQAFQSPIRIKDSSFLITFSMGIAIVPIHGKDFDSLVGAADMAMYIAKNAGKNQYKFFDENSQLLSEQHALLKTEIIKAVEQNSLTIEYQCIYQSKTDRIFFAEAMLRWHSSFGNISPLKFIPMAKELGLMSKLSHFVFESVFELSNIVNSKEEKTYISVNLSTYELLSSALIPDIMMLLEQYKTDPTYINLEISEQLIDREFDVIKQQIEHLSQLGFKITIDNFGAEYMSLNNLKKLPITFVKIDIAQIAEMSSNKNILNALFDILREMSIAIIIKGVESDTDLSFLKGKSYDFVQGRHYSYPVTQTTLLTMLLDEEIKIYNPKIHENS
jgi:diguanylate cyclase (GGDEF)-like protein